MCVFPPDGAVRIWAYADRFANGLLHAFHVSPGHALLKVLRVIPVSVREQCDQRDNTKASTIADDENDAHLANVADHLTPPWVKVERKKDNPLWVKLRTQSAGGG